MRSHLNIWEVLSSVGTLVAACAAWYSASASQRSANESRRATEASFMPIIEPIELVPYQDSNMQYYGLMLLNSGRGIALNVELEIPILNLLVKVPSIKEEGQVSESTEKTEIDLGLWEELKKSGLSFEITYTDVFGNRIATNALGKVFNHQHRMDFDYTVAYVDG